MPLLLQPDLAEAGEAPKMAPESHPSKVLRGYSGGPSMMCLGVDEVPEIDEEGIRRTGGLAGWLDACWGFSTEVDRGGRSPHRCAGCMLGPARLAAGVAAVGALPTSSTTKICMQAACGARFF